jgi:hypothetical protein
MPKPFTDYQLNPSKALTVTITCKFGSDMQKEVAKKTLTDLLAIWKGEVEKNHQRNKITIKET